MTFLIRLRPSWPRPWWRWRAHDGPQDGGMVTVEYALGTLAAAALAALLYVIVNSRAVAGGLASLVQRAISAKS